MKKNWHKDDYERRIKAEAQHFSSKAKAIQKNSDKVERFSPKVPAFDEAMKLYQVVFYEKMPHMALEKYILDYASSNNQNTKIVSLGCGTGDWEVVLVEKLDKISMDLVEINSELLKYVKEYSEKHQLKVNTIIQDVNKLDLEPSQYDFVIVRSSLHHFVELEHVFEEIKKILKPNGKFLVMGEVIGRNGQLLYNETREIVNNVMKILPEKFHLNHNTNEIDSVFPDIDYAKDSFEAIRSEDIYSLILKYFKSVEHIAFDAIISYLLDFRYGPNYDVNIKLDKSIIELIVNFDRYYLENNILKPTCLFGIFEKR
ncbi:MAG: Methyltransferase type 12 [Nitrosarchaeum sp.]|nr:Methyltransferase type 12 [Nitrosarchaeum sp.]